MNTRNKGDQLEDTFFKLLTREINADRFYFKKTCCRIFKQKGYYSRDRQADIVFDIAIEVFLPGQAEQFSILVLVECKNYDGSVPASDIEEFCDKIGQVSGANVKGVLATNSAFQKSALNVAEARGLGVVRHNKSKLKWVLNRSPASFLHANTSTTPFTTHAYRGLTESRHTSRQHDLHCGLHGRFTNSLWNFFEDLTKNLQPGDLASRLHLMLNSPPVSLVEFRSEQDIESAAAKVLEAVDYHGGATPLEAICSWQTDVATLDVDLNDGHGGSGTVLGEITFNPARITVYVKACASVGRRRFTLAHELGHLFMDHGRYMAGEYCEEADFLSKADASRTDPTIDDVARMEWQANHFAASLLLPMDYFLGDVLTMAKELGLRDRGHGLIYLDGQRCNLEPYYVVTNALKRKYEVSRQVVDLRLRKYGLLAGTHKKRV